VALLSIAEALVMHEQSKDKNDRQRNADQPQKQTSSKAHDILLIPFNKTPQASCGSMRREVS
jgi:hypothetical protein